MKIIPITYFCITKDELITALIELKLENMKAVRSGTEFSAATKCILPKFVDVLESEMSFIVAPNDRDIAFVTASSWWRRAYLAVCNSNAPLGPSLSSSPDAALLRVPAIHELRRQIIPGFVSSYPKESELYKRLVSKVSEIAHRKDRFLVSPRVADLMDEGYKIWLE